MARFIGGQIPHKMRFDNHPSGLPWLESRMPAFPSRAAALSAGLSAQAGFPPRSPAEPPLDPALAAAGHKLVGKDGGLSCVQCHAVGPMAAMDVFESEGINLAWSADRLQPEFYRRWLRAPLSVDPQTKMPTYFEDGRSPITDVLEGDGERQIQGIWHYLRQGDRMPKPRTGLE
jgi:mono/diheme cytochrome c family protein